MNDPKRSFGVVTPYCKNLSNSENDDRYIDMLKTIKNKMEYGYIQLKCGYTDQNGFNERNLALVPSITKFDLINFGNQYEQNIVLYKNQQELEEIQTGYDGKNGKIIKTFDSPGNGENINLNHNLLEQLISSILQVSNNEKKYSFIIEEKRSPGMYVRLRLLKQGKKIPWMTIAEGEIN